MSDLVQRLVAAVDGHGRAGPVDDSASEMLRELRVSTSDDAAAVAQCIDALRRRMDDTKAEIEAELEANWPEYEKLVTSAAEMQAAMHEEAIRLKAEYNRIRHPETGLLPRRLKQLEIETEQCKLAQHEEQRKKVSAKIESFKESVEACKMILTEFGDLHDAADTIADLKSQLESIGDSEGIMSHSELENIYLKTREYVVHNVENVFWDAVTIQRNKGVVDIRIKASVPASLPNQAIDLKSVDKILRMLDIQNDIYSNLGRILIKSVLIPLIDSSAALLDQTNQITDASTESCLKFVLDESRKPRFEQVLSNISEVFRFLTLSLFPEASPSQECVNTVWSNLSSCLIDKALVPIIPKTPATLREFPVVVAKKCEDFEEEALAMGWTPSVSQHDSGGTKDHWRHLTEFCSKIETHYCLARSEYFMEVARSAIINDDFQFTNSAELIRSDSDSAVDLNEFFKYLPDEVENMSEIVNSPIYPKGSTGAECFTGFLAFPSCAVSRRAATIVNCLENILAEATAEGISSYCSSRLYLLTRDILTLDMTLTPIKNRALLNSLAQSAMIYHNDCFYTAHQLLTFERKYKHLLCSGGSSVMTQEEVGYTDFVAAYRNSGTAVFNGQLMVQKTNILEIISSLNGFSMNDPKRAVEVRRALEQVVLSIKQLSSVWAPPVSPPVFFSQVMAGLALWVFEAATAEVLELADIGDEESHLLHDILTGLETALLGSGGVSKRAVVRLIDGNRNVHARFRKTTEMLVMNFAGIMQLVRGGRAEFLGPDEDGGLGEFRAEEIVRLVRALFSDTELRTRNVEEILARMSGGKTENKKNPPARNTANVGARIHSPHQYLTGVDQCMMPHALLFRVSAAARGSGAVSSRLPRHPLNDLTPSAMLRLPMASFASASSRTADPDGPAKATRKKLRLLKKDAVAVPKRPPLPHVLFFKEKYATEATSATYAKLSGIAKTAAILKAIMARYKVLPAAEKEAYAKRYAEMKATYQKEYAKFLSSRTPEQLIVQEKVRTLQKKLNPEKHLSKVGKDPNAPKKPESAYLLFLKKNRGSADLSTVAKQWKALSAAEKIRKQPFTAEYLKAKERYIAAKENYEKSTGISETRKAINKALAKAVKKPTTGRKKKSVAGKRKSPKKASAIKKPVKRTSKVAKKTTVKRRTSKTAVKKVVRKPVKKAAKSGKKVLLSRKK
ncbi:Centromere/kinetochore protein zw10 [Entophlyctis sp. JEL0112]|nr:Centromere/kinetochore protein zw10 [Entophlyctis sp. JEL0112]